ncbi:MAG: methyl-accepting chemotaxis protein [Paraglaciecola sp.]|jgi:methyl-accepting chemotaxis protein
MLQGSHGCSFAVVADDLIQLAARTSKSIAEIDQVVKHNNQLAGVAVKTMQTMVAEAVKVSS